MIRSAHVDTFARDNLPPREEWPEFLLDVPEVRYPDRMNAAVELLDATVAAGHGERIALRTDDAVCTYRQLQAQVDRIARVLTEDLGLVPGNRVLLRGANHPMMAACWFAVVKAGLIAVATMPLLRAAELEPIIEKAQIRAALCDVRLKDELLAAAGRCPVLQDIVWFNDGDGRRANPGSLEDLCQRKPPSFVACDTAVDDVALIAFTSGTTGRPKGTMHFHRDVIAMCDLFPRSVLRPTADDVFCGTPPLAFTFGLGGMLCFPMRVGASTLLLERLTPQTLLEAIQRHRATVCFTAPTFYRQMAQIARDYDLSSLAKCVSAGEALPDATRQAFKQATGIEIIDGIGATEMIHIFISSPPEDVRRGAIGKVVPGYRAQIVDAQMNPLPPGEIGRLAVKGPTGCRYLADPRQRDYVRDGWNLTGDTFTMDEDGYFFYQARSDDMIISAGYNIAGPEVEAALLAHDAVAECGVVGVPDPERGQIVKAFIVLKPGMVASQGLVQALQDHVKRTIAPYKYPRAIEFRDTLPRTETGKLQRFRLKQPGNSEGSA
ncbi:MAG TPA: benzoate-CoA ligase family protein [Burkholderiaceae bacterium]|nr:benzoate-CoA ligase family protein [Burkholderiaceae bacterium]